MLVDTYRFGKINVHVASIHGEKVLLVLQTVFVAATKDHEAGVLKEGWLLVKRNGKYAIYESIEAAMRGFHKAVKLYGDQHRGEEAAMAAMSAAADAYMHEIMNEDGLKRDAQAVIDSILAGEGALLAGASNGHKQAARRELIAAASPVDRLGRRNPGRRHLLLAQARNHLQARTKEIGRIRNAILPLLTSLGACYRDRVLALREMKAGLEHLLAPADGKGTAPVDQLCRHMIDRAGALNVEPFLNCRDSTVGNLSLARAALRQGARNDAARSLQRALMGVRIGLARVRLEDIRVQLELVAPDDPLIGTHAPDDPVERQRVRMAHFLSNLKTVDDTDMNVRHLDVVRSLSEQAYAVLVHSSPPAEASALLGKAVALL